MYQHKRLLYHLTASWEQSFHLNWKWALPGNRRDAVHWPLLADAARVLRHGEDEGDGRPVSPRVFTATSGYHFLPLGSKALAFETHAIHSVTPLSSLEVTVIRSGTNFLSHSKQTVSSASGFLFEPSPAWIRFPVNNCPRANPEFPDPPHLRGPCFLSALHHPLSCQ